MKTICFLALIAVLLIADTAYPVFSGEAGHFMQRDPLGYRDGMGVYQYVGSEPISTRDWTGRAKCLCGPDMTRAFVRRIQKIDSWAEENNVADAPLLAKMKWLRENGVLIDFGINITHPKCGRGCAKTYTVCGVCVHDHWGGNFTFGYLGRKLGIADAVMNAAANAVQGGDEADWGVKNIPKDQKVIWLDPPWDVAGYDLARTYFDDPNKFRPPWAVANQDDFCEFLRRNADLANKSNDLSDQGKLVGRLDDGREVRYPFTGTRPTKPGTCVPCKEEASRPQDEIVLPAIEAK